MAKAPSSAPLPPNIVEDLAPVSTTMADLMQSAESFLGVARWPYSEPLRQVPASADTVAAVLRTALDRQPETRGMEVTVEAPDHDDPACPWMKATADGFSGRILTGSYSRLLDCSGVFARVLQGRRDRAEREAAIARHPCCVCLVAIGGRCLTCKAQGGSPEETILSSIAKSHRCAPQHDTKPEGYGFRLDHDGDMIDCPAHGDAAESLGLQVRTALPEGWRWNPAYSCCADGPGRTWALVESHEGHPAKGSIGTHNDLPAPPDVLSALVTEARRLGIPVKWEPQDGDVVVLTDDNAPATGGLLGRVGRVKYVTTSGGVRLAAVGFGELSYAWRTDCLRPATTAEAASA